MHDDMKVCESGNGNSKFLFHGGGGSGGAHFLCISVL